MLTDRVRPTSARWSVSSVIWGLLALATFLLVAYYARVGPISPRVANHQILHAPPRIDPQFGYHHWPTVLQIGTAISTVCVLVFCVIQWRRHRGHPYLLMALASTVIVWQDPIMNWSTYAVYESGYWHWPEDWPLFSLAPTFQPFVVVGYVVFYFGPAFPAIWALRRIQARRPIDSVVSRHPLISLACLILVIGSVMDAILEICCVRAGMYIYSQVIPFGSVFVGTRYQFPLLWESLLITLVMIPAGVLVYRDDTGRTVAEKLAQRARVFPRHPAVATFTVMFAVLSVAYAVYGASFTLIKWTRAATSVACPWPYPDLKVYDPQGFYEHEGQPGPYSPGKWSTWIMGQPHGRPAVEKPADGGRCSTKTNADQPAA